MTLPACCAEAAHAALNDFMSIRGLRGQGFARSYVAQALTSTASCSPSCCLGSACAAMTTFSRWLKKSAVKEGRCMDRKLSHSWLPLSRKLQPSMHLYLKTSSSTSPVPRICCASACRPRQLASDEHQADAEYVRQTLLLHVSPCRCFRDAGCSHCSQHRPFWHLKHSARDIGYPIGSPLQELGVLCELIMNCFQPPGQLPHGALVCRVLRCSLALLQAPKHPASAHPPEQDIALSSCTRSHAYGWQD